MTLFSSLHEQILAAGSDNLRVFGGDYCGGCYLQQSPMEFAGLIEFLMDKDVSNYLEIGAASGGCTFLMDKFLDLENIYIIDDNNHHRSVVRGEVLKDVGYEEWIGNSHDKEAIAEVGDSGHIFDLVMIDGDHSYQGVKMDTLDYMPYVREGGYVVFHDITTHRCGVKDWVAEIKEIGFGLTHVIDFIDRAKDLGIGVYQKI